MYVPIITRRTFTDASPSANRTAFPIGVSTCPTGNPSGPQDTYEYPRCASAIFFSLSTMTARSRSSITVPMSVGLCVPADPAANSVVDAIEVDFGFAPPNAAVTACIWSDPDADGDGEWIQDVDGNIMNMRDPNATIYRDADGHVEMMEPDDAEIEDLYKMYQERVDEVEKVITKPDSKFSDETGWLDLRWLHSDPLFPGLEPITPPVHAPASLCRAAA